MKKAVIDVGSNTIRTVVYEIEENSYRAISNERDFSSLIGYVENGALNQDGIDKLIFVLRNMAALCKAFQCEKIHCFATASLRNLSNLDYILKYVKDKTGLDIEVLSGMQEAIYDYAGLKSIVDTHNGVGLDLGGGSCQIFSYRKSLLKDTVSLPIGCLKMRRLFVTGDFPTALEADNIHSYVSNSLKDYPAMKSLGYPVIYAIGGTARAAAKLYNSLKNEETDSLTVSQLDFLCTFSDNTDSNKINFLKTLLPERWHTIIPGLIVLKTVCDYVGAESIQIIQAGIREGYLHEKLLKQEDSYDT